MYGHIINLHVINVLCFTDKNPIINLLIEIKNQNRQILNLLQHKTAELNDFQLPADIPVAIPLKSI